MLEDFIDAMENFAKNKTRTLLSLLGVIIGVASVIVITSMGASSTKEVQDTFGGAGLDIVSISAGYMKKRSSNGVLLFDEKFRRDLFDEIEGIKKVWYKNNLAATLTNGELSSATTCSAIETGYLEIYGYELEGGEFFGLMDNEEGTQKIILTSETAQSLFPKGDALGSTVMVVAGNATFGFTVSGVLKEHGAGIETGTAFIPRGFYDKKILSNPEANTILVQAEDIPTATALVEKIKSWCAERSGSEYSVNVTSLQATIDQMGKITSNMSMTLSAIALISLLVGGIGIMNIMIVTVTERKEEIGIRKALGATPKDIRRQFLVESASITLLGGILGIAAGIAVSLATEYVKGGSYTISLASCAVSFAFSVLVGIFFGSNPASRAAKLDPVLALAAGE